MKRELKNMYTEMLLDTIINCPWQEERHTYYGVFDTTQYTFKSPKVSPSKYGYRFEHFTGGLFSKNVQVFVYTDSSNFSVGNDTLTYSIFSPVYWRLVQMRLDRLNSSKIAETNLYMDTYKEFKEYAVERDIAKVEESLANLAKAEAEQRKMLEDLKAKELK
jgi:hypothetical protein